MNRLTRYILVTGTVLLLLFSSAAGVWAQAGGPQVRITQVDNSRFPQVTVYVSVTDGSGQPVGVDLSTIQIFENGQRMEPISFGGGGQGGVGPLTTMLVMDVSGSMDKSGKIDGARAAARAYVDQMRPGDQAGLVVYNTKYTYSQPLTEDHSLLKSAIDSIETGGDTAMYDALFAAAEMLRELPGRKAILAVTDGLDNSSSHNADDVLNAIGPSGLSISTIGLGDPTTRAQTGLDEAGLRSLAQRAGGGYSVAGDAAALSVLFQSYGRELQNEYALTYTSPSTLRDGVNRDLRVTLSGAAAAFQSKYNPGGVLPEVASHSWILFGALFLALVVLLVLPLLFGSASRVLRRPRKRGRIKLIGSGSPSAPLAKGRIKLR